MKGILMAGGAGTRLYPVTQVMSKQLLPVYDKPMIYYPLSVLMLAGLRDLLVVSTPRDLPHFRRLLGDGSAWGMCLSYAEQPEPRGLAEGLVIGRDFVGAGGVALAAGDNVFYGQGLGAMVRRAAAQADGATVFACPVTDPEHYGVVDFDAEGRVRAIEEKPQRPRSDHAITGLYFYDAQAPAIAAGLVPSARGELEVTDVNMAYLQCGQLRVERLGRGTVWLDTGTPASLHEASSVIGALDRRQGLKVGCPEEVAYRMGFIDAAQLRRLAGRMPRGGYGRYLLALADG